MQRIAEQSRKEIKKGRKNVGNGLFPESEHGK
jgi:hypothetical protein